jgi:hypothetical protein
MGIKQKMTPAEAHQRILDFYNKDYLHNELTDEDLEAIHILLRQTHTLELVKENLLYCDLFLKDNMAAAIWRVIQQGEKATDLRRCVFP